jgi:hypothetical protein
MRMKILSGALSILIFLLSAPLAVEAYLPVTWTQQTSTGADFWSQIASSDDGIKLAAVAQSGYVRTSIDSGTTWTTRTGSGNRSWWAITSSANGTHLAAVVYAGYIYTSTDSGVTWTEQTNSGQRQWQSIASSDDGMTLIAAPGFPGGGYIYTSTDGGATWTERQGAGSGRWGSFAVGVSGDGQTMAAGRSNGTDPGLYYSKDGGANWTQAVAAAHFWVGVQISRDGSKLSALDSNNGYVNVSNDGGQNWTTRTALAGVAWQGYSASEDQSRMLAVAYGNIPNYVYSSDDNGVTWTTYTDYPPSNQYWYGAACSADCTRAVVAANFPAGYIYTARLFMPEPPPITPGVGGGLIVGSGPLAPSAEGLPGYTPPRPQTIYPDGHIVYLDSTSTVTILPPPYSVPTMPPPELIFPYNRQLWDRGEDIRILQTFFNSIGITVARQGPGSPGNETSIFGNHTYWALLKFQEAKNLPVTGYMGPATREVLENLVKP